MIFSPVDCKDCDALALRIMSTDGKVDQLKCDYCGYKTSAPVKSLKHLYKGGINKYPYISGSLGQVVNSRDHEDSVAKKMGYVPQEHTRVKVPRISANPHRRKR